MFKYFDEFDEALKELGDPLKSYSYPYKVLKDYNPWGVEYTKTFTNEEQAPNELFESILNGVPNGYLPAILGKNEDGVIKYFDLSGQNTLVAGQTRSGKTTWLNTLAVSLLHFGHPEYLKLVILDPKQAGFKAFKTVATVSTSYLQIYNTLIKLNEELQKRIEFTAQPDTPVDAKSCNTIAYKARNKAYLMPYIVVIFDEFADFVNSSAKTKEGDAMNIMSPVEIIHRLSALGMGLGIHLLFSTQAPYSEYIKGAVKNNFERRISFSLGDTTQELLVLGRKFNDEDMRTHILSTGEFLLRHKGKRIHYKGVLATPDSVANAVKNWVEAGLNYKLF